MRDNATENRDRWRDIARALRDALREVWRIRRRLMRVAAEGGCAGRALLCYIDTPFRTDARDANHSNRYDARAIADVLAEMGYEVWVADYRTRYPVDYSKYRLLFGFGDVFERSFHTPYTGRRIFFATGASPCHQLFAEARRLRDLQRRKGRLLKPVRITDRAWAASAVLSDGIVVYGNSWTASTFSGQNPVVTTIQGTYTPAHPASAVGKDFDKRRRGFLFFSGGGAVHKGLDLALDAMDEKGAPLNLHVCGPFDTERDFLHLYRDHLRGRANIRYHGFTDVRSGAFLDVLKACAFVLLPTCSEGTATSVLTCMAAGLIPVVTKESGVDIEGFGVQIEEATPADVARAMRAASRMKPEEIAERSKAAAAHAQRRHSREAFRESVRRAVLSILAES